MHETYKKGRNDIAPECTLVWQFLWAVRQGYASATMPHRSGMASFRQLLALLPSDGIRLKSLRLVDETIDVPTARLLCEMVCLDVEGHHLSCLHLGDCRWEPGAMAALAPSMLHSGRSNRLEALILQSSSSRQCLEGAPQDLFESLGQVLGDSRCSLYALSLMGMLGWDARSGITLGAAYRNLYRRNAPIAKGMLTNRSLRYLSTGDCVVNKEQLVAWADTLVAHRALRQVLLSFISKSPEASDALGAQVERIVCENVSIRHLMLFYDMIPEKTRLPLCLLWAAIRRNRALLSISVGYSGLNSWRYEAEFSRQHDRNLDAVVANPRIVFYDWRTSCVPGKYARTVPLMLTRLQHYQSRQSRLWALVRHRTAAQAHRDAGLVWRAAAEGRPLELAKRLRLGVMAGGAERKGLVSGKQLDAAQAAEAGGHTECALLVRRSLVRELNRRAVHFGNLGCTSGCTCLVL